MNVLEPCKVIVEVLNVPGLRDRTTPRFRRAAVYLALSLGLDPSALLAVMSFETARTFSPSVRAGGDPDAAVGLIQFTKGAADRLGTTKDKLAAMTPLEQLDWARRYFELVIAGTSLKPESWTACDHYLAVFAPAGIGRAEGFALYRAPSREYDANRPMDLDGDGVITVADACERFLASTIRPVMRAEPLKVDTVGLFGRVAPAALAGGAAAMLAARAGIG